MNEIAAARRDRHAGETGNPAPAQQTEEDRLGLIVGMMRGHEIIRTDLCGIGAKKRIARLSRTLLNCRLGLRAFPKENPMR